MEKKNIGQFLINITDSKKYNENEILNNLKDCLKGKKCCIISCGANMNEHINRFNELHNDDIILLCIKSSVQKIDYECDILYLDGNINGNYLNNVKLNNIFKISSFITHSNKNYVNYNNVIDYNIKSDYFYFLHYIGITEIYLFGFYLADYIIKDLTNYNYYDDLISNSSHYYEINTNSRTKECGLFSEYFRLLNYGNKYNIYNVSNFGCLPKNIKRISFDDIFEENKKIIEYMYEDYNDIITNQFDFDFYCNKYLKKYITCDYEMKKKHCLNNFHCVGIYLLYNVNINDTKKSIIVNEIMSSIMCLISYVLRYGNCLYNQINDNNNIAPFLNHYIIKLNKTLNVCFYNDYEKISNENYWNELLFNNANKINMLFENIDENDLHKIYCNNFFNNNKYFKLLYVLFYYYKLPNDFNINEYKEINKDLQKLSNLEAIKHYINTGIKEGKKYKKDI